MLNIDIDAHELLDLCQHLDRIKNIYDERTRDERFSKDYRAANAMRLDKVTLLLKKLDKAL